MPDASAFDAAYGRLAAMRPAADGADGDPPRAPEEERPSPAGGRRTKRSPLLARLFLMKPASMRGRPKR